MAGAGVDTVVVAVTDGEASHPTARHAGHDLAMTRAIERQCALNRLGCGSTDIQRLGFVDGSVAEQRERLTEALCRLLGPDDLCLAPWRSDGHPDHDAAGQAAVAAAQVTNTRLLEYPVWAWHWARPESADLPWSQCSRFDLGRRQAARKRWASYAFRSQIRPLGPDHDGGPLLSDAVLRRFWRPFEIFIGAAA
jgi:LmbE family N-acetylglucosaminyl deacetylase